MLRGNIKNNKKSQIERGYIHINFNFELATKIDTNLIDTKWLTLWAWVLVG